MESIPDMSSMNTIAITGASGFIGKHLVTELLRLDGFRIKLLSRDCKRDSGALNEKGVEIVEGDLRKPESLRGFLEEGCTVVNLVYLRGAGGAENIAAVTNLLEACKSAIVGRLIHCSTADVVGRVLDNFVTESIPCLPATEYGITKLKIENAILATAKDNFDAGILRPTAVFGSGGGNLRKLANDLTTKNRLQNYLKSCLFDKRRMNLVSVTNVVAAIIFLINRTENLNGEIFIVSDDDSPSNNFADVERFLMREFGIPDYSLPCLPVPPAFLKFLLICLSRNNINPLCNYSSDKLLSLGYERASSFETGLAEFAAWYRSSHIDGQESVAA